MKNFLFIGVCAALFLQSNRSYADWYGEIGAAQGGDKIDIVVTDEDGDEKNRALEIGGGLNLELGGINYFNDFFSLQYGLGYKFDSVVAGKDSVSFRRYPLNAIGSFDLGEMFQLGVGLTYELDPTLNLRDAGQGSYDADNAFGTILQMGWKWGSARILIRHTRIEYTFVGDLNGNNTGIHLGFIW